MTDERNPQPIVRVGATAESSVVPDIALFTISFGNRCKTQQACADDFANEQRKAIDILSTFGLGGDLKFSGYSSYAHRAGKKGIIDGYDYSCWGTLRIPRENYDIHAIWQALSDSKLHASLRLTFELDDERSAEDALIDKAVARARHSAETLAHAAGMELGGVCEIRYQSGGGPFLRMCSDFAAPSSASDDGPEFEPEPIDIECHVDADWWLVEPAS